MARKDATDKPKGKPKGGFEMVKRGRTIRALMMLPLEEALESLPEGSLARIAFENHHAAINSRDKQGELNGVAMKAIADVHDRIHGKPAQTINVEAVTSVRLVAEIDENIKRQMALIGASVVEEMVKPKPKSKGRKG